MAKPSKTQRSPPAGGTWTLAGAKARLSEVVDRAQAGPQTITRNGKPSAVIVSAEEWARKTMRQGTLAEFLLASPLRGADLELERQRDAPRDVNVWIFCSIPMCGRRCSGRHASAKRILPLRRSACGCSTRGTDKWLATR
jgi:prevent-host-death family protein